VGIGAIWIQQRSEIGVIGRFTRAHECAPQGVRA
jgi:hypothetical protein